MKSIKLLLDGILEEIRPDKNYEKEIFNRLNWIIKKINQSEKNIKAILGGSGAKGTWLKTFDADIFVLFEYKKFRDKSDKLSDILGKILKKKFKKIMRLHGSRDYFQIKQNGFTFEIVPILKIQKAYQAKNITDVSPLHSNWVKKHKKLASEMRLTKQFCQAQNLYGAESYIRGFSGYVCEILTVYYGSFLNLMRNAAKWGDRVVIDAKGYYKRQDIFRLLNTSKLISPLVVIDPVQKDRNAAAALSVEKFEAFKKAAREFLENPSNVFFQKKNLKEFFLLEKSKNSKLIVIYVAPLTGKTDIVGGRLLKMYGFLASKLKEQDFSLTKSDWEWDKKTNAIFYFLVDSKPLQKYVKIKGPPIKISNHFDKFRRLHKKVFVKSGIAFALEQRKFLVPEDFLKTLIKSQFLKDRCKSIKIGIF